jgi:lysophospholipase L1-like esterase
VALNLKKRNKKKRIICIGDSLTFGWGALDEETYPAILGKLLAPDFEVINGGSHWV